MLPEHMHSPDSTVGPNSITETGALCISSGSKTGRVPKQKRIVADEMTNNVSTQLSLVSPSLMGEFCQIAHHDGILEILCQVIPENCQNKSQSAYFLA